MFRTLRSKRLCPTCRSNLQQLFERGFASSAEVIRPRHSSLRTLPRQYAHARTFTVAKPLYDDESSQKQNESTGDEYHELSLEEEMLAVQNTAIAELEQKLGKPLRQAIEEDDLAQKVLTQEQSEELVDQEKPSESTIEEHILRQLRAAGSSKDELARGARQLFGESLPDDILTDAEFKVYKRMYGEPEPATEDDGLEDDATDLEHEPTNKLFDIQGDQVSYRLESAREIEDAMSSKETEFEEEEEEDVGQETYEALGQITPGVLDPSIQNLAVPESSPGDILKAGEWEAENREGPRGSDTRSHPLTRLGKFATYPRTTFLPKSTFVRPIERMMGDYSNKHLKETCERLFGGPGLPNSPLTPRSGRTLPQIPIPLQAGQSNMGQMEANAFMTTIMPPTYATILSILVETRKRLGASWVDKLLGRPGGPRILDAGSGGVGVLAWREIVQAHWETLHSSDRKPPPPPESKGVVLTGSDTLRHRAAGLLENTTFVPRLPDYVHTRDTPTLEDERPAQPRKQFDLIIASHSLFPLKEEWERKQHIQNLWSLLSDEGGVLIFVEKGIPRGFEAIAGARETLLERFIHSPVEQPPEHLPLEDPDPYQKRTTGMIVAPCTNHEKCPLYRVPGHSRGRKDFCGFQQRYIRPPFLQRILGAKDRNHDDADYSYISVMKGDDLRNRHISNWEQVDDPISAPVHPDPPSLAENPKTWLDNVAEGFESFQPSPATASSTFTSNNPQSENDQFKHPDGITRPNLPTANNLPRLIWSPLKNKGHATLDVCTPAGTLERWIIPRSFSKQAYRDARKARWGDLWALGAKTRMPRNVRVGVSEKDIEVGEGKTKGLLGKATSKKERKEMQREMLLDAEEMDSDTAQFEFDEIEDALDEEDDFVNEDSDGFISPETLLPQRRSGKPPKPKRPSGPQRKRSRPKPDSGPADRYGDLDPLIEWARDFEDDRRSTRPGSGKHGGAFSGKNSSSTSAAKREQKRRAREAR